MAIELDNSFTVPVPPDQAWDVLLDVERIAPCMPGASVLSVDGDEITGQVKVKLGPLSLSYKGKAEFTEKDVEKRTLAIKASGKEARGAGTASATVNVVLKPGDAADSTLVAIHTSLNVTGRPAQFGRSLLPEVSGKLIGQFATNLDALISDGGGSSASSGGAPSGGAPGAGASAGSADASGAPADAGSAATATGTGTGTPEAPLPSDAALAAPAPKPAAQREDSLNVIKLVGIPVLKRVVPALAGATVIALITRRLRRK